MKHLFALILTIGFVFSVSATTQMPDYFVYKGVKYSVNHYIMDTLFAKYPDKKPKTSITSTALWRGYIATYEVVNNELFLKDIQIEVKDASSRNYVFKSAMATVQPSGKSLKLDWYTGLLILPGGNSILDSHFSWVENRENYLVLEFNKGKLTGELRMNFDEFLKFEKQQFEAFQKTTDYQAMRQAKISRGISEDEIASSLKYNLFKFTSSILVPYNKKNQSLDFKEPVRHALIKTFVNDKLVSIKGFDKQQRPIFSYSDEGNNTQPLISVSGTVYSENGKRIRSYWLHSNIGLTVSYYEYDASGNVRVYTVGNKDRSLCSVSFVGQFTSLKTLLNHPVVKEAEKETNKKLTSAQTFDDRGNLLTFTVFDDSGDTSSFVKTEYNSNNKPVYQYSFSRYGGGEKYVSETNIEYISRYMGENGAKSQEIWMTFAVKKDKRSLNEMYIYSYDLKKRLTEVLSYSSGRFNSRYVYEYKDSIHQEKISYYKGGPNNLEMTQINQFNEEGLLTSELQQEYYKLKTYRYEFE